MSFVIELRWTFCSVELINTNVVLICASEQMSPMRKSNLSTALNWDFLEGFQTLLEYIHHSHFISESNNDMESRWMKSQTEGFILKALTNFQSLLLIIPNSNCFIDTASTNQMLLNADIHSMDGSWVEWIDQILVFSIIRWSFDVNSYLHNLVVFSGED